MTPRSLLALVTPVAPSAVWGAWTFDPLVVAGSIAAAVLYARGHRYLGARLDREARSSASRRAMAFACGLATTDLALLSPLHAMSDALFSAHMVQHLVLIVVAVPLLVLARPVRTMLAGLSPRTRRMLARSGSRSLWGSTGPRPVATTPRTGGSRGSGRSGTASSSPFWTRRFSTSLRRSAPTPAEPFAARR